MSLEYLIKMESKEAIKDCQSFVKQSKEPAQ